MITQHPSRIQALLRAYRKHTMEIDTLFFRIQDWATAPHICRPTPTQLQAIIRAKNQLLVQYPMSFRNIIGEALKYGLDEMPRFYLENNFDEDPALLGVCSENPVIAITYASEYTRLNAVQFAERIRILLTEPLLHSRLLRAGKAVQSALIQRALHYLPETAEGAALLTDLLNTIPAGFEPYHFTVIFRELHFVPFLADALFRHPAARPHLYVEYAAKYENKAAALLSWHDLSQQSLRAWKAVDKRTAEERTRLRQAAWRLLFWGSAVLQWRKREFVERYYAPGGKGTATVEANFYKSIRTEQQATDEHTDQETPTHSPSTHEQDSRGCGAHEYYRQDSQVTICAAVTLP
jgi:hypothetical protein